MNAGERVDDGQAINLFVVFRLDVAAGEITKNPIAHPEIVAVLELVHGGRLVIDERAVRALQIDHVITIDARLDTGMMTGDRLVGNGQIAIVVTAQNDGRIAEHVARTHPGPGWIDVNQAGLGSRYMLGDS